GWSGNCTDHSSRAMSRCSAGTRPGLATVPCCVAWCAQAESPASSTATNRHTARSIDLPNLIGGLSLLVIEGAADRAATFPTQEAIAAIELLAAIELCMPLSNEHIATPCNANFHQSSWCD